MTENENFNLRLFKQHRQGITMNELDAHIKIFTHARNQIAHPKSVDDIKTKFSNIMSNVDFVHSLNENQK
jgi:hypothetical protein